MSSILTNNSAMVALQTLQSINKDLAKTQDMISTGQRISSAKDNSAIWSIAKTMESDIAGFKSVTDSLNLGQSTVAVARNGAESVRDMLEEMKGLITQAPNENVSREDLQEQLSSLRDQVNSITGAAQFNGLNLLSNTDTTAGSGASAVVGSLDRSATGVVTAADIDVNKQDLGTGASTVGTLGTTVGNAGTINDGASGTAFSLDATNAVEAGQSFQITAVGAVSFSSSVDYVARDGDTLADVREELITRLNFQAQADGQDLTFSANTANGTDIEMANNSGANITVVAADGAQNIGGTGGAFDGTIGGGLEVLADFDISTENGANAALAAIDDLIATATGAAAGFGTSEKRIEIQAEFIGKLTDSLKSGIGALTDTDMEEASARLQALQVQQQLGVQALSIANQAPQSLLSLFR